MATIRNPNEEEQGPVQLGSAPAPGTPGGATVGKSGGKPFVSLAAYLDANKGNVGQTTQKIAGGLQGDIDGARNAIDQGSAAFGQQVAGGVANVGAPIRGVTQQAYNGPQGFDTSPYLGQLSQLQNKAQLTQTGAGLGQLLKGTYGGRFTRGMQTLDGALMQGDPNAAKTFAGVRQAVGPLGSYLDSAAQKGNAAVASAQQGVAQNNKRYGYQQQAVAPSTPDQMDAKAAAGPPGAGVLLGNGAVGFNAPTSPIEQAFMRGRQPLGKRDDRLRFK